MPKQILLINYSFPPYSGVGGRRWAKLTKYLAIDDYKIHVINAQSFQTKTSLFNHDVVHKNISVYSIPNLKESLVSKIRNVFLRRIIEKMFFVTAQLAFKGNHVDQSVWWNRHAFNKSAEIIRQHAISNVIISCPPYHSMYYFSKLKLLFPNINLILDYRDIWTIGQDEKGFFNTINDQRFADEAKFEIEAITLADKIVTVSEVLSQNIKSRFKLKEVYTITNGFDPDDNLSREMDCSQWVKPNYINICFGGSLVDDSNVYAFHFLDMLNKIKQNNLELYKRLNIQVFGFLNQPVLDKIKQLGIDIIHINEPLPSHVIVSLYKAFDFLLMFLNPYYTYAYISKFFDYLLAKKPILCYSTIGEFPLFLERNNLGLNINANSLQSDLEAFLSKKSSFQYNIDFEMSKFSYENIAKDYQSILI